LAVGVQLSPVSRGKRWIVGERGKVHFLTAPPPPLVITHDNRKHALREGRK